MPKDEQYERVRLQNISGCTVHPHTKEVFEDLKKRSGGKPWGVLLDSIAIELTRRIKVDDGGKCYNPGTSDFEWKEGE